MEQKLWVDDHPIVKALCYIACIFVLVVNGTFLLASFGVI